LPGAAACGHIAVTASRDTASTMSNIRIIDSISDAGSASRPNEDAAGGNATCAFVIDGATGLGGKSIVGLHGSDAAWLAQFAQSSFEQMVRPGREMAEIVQEFNACAANVVHEAAHALPIEPWNLPVASFQIVRIEDDALVTYGLGDCRLFLVGGDGKVIETSALKGAAQAEREGARLALAHAGGFSAYQALAEEPTVRDELRRRRAAYNSPASGVWTLGVEPEAGNHLASEPLNPALPATGLLCSDGFAALADQYLRYSPQELVAAARENGLSTLLDELRRIERVEDPDGTKYPRFKMSDDATALLFEIIE
jgi:hypothetical protein